ncbi:MAG: DUF3800 domain-containing protein [Flavobacterium sp.]|nr:DUF3800 domain-containing protein [Flavobacterium sp.]
MDKKKVYLFIDESGDASFYAKKNKLLVGTDGFQPLLLLGLIVLEDKKQIHNTIKSLQEDIKNDTLYNSLKCVSNPKGWYFHARNDQPEIRTKFIELIRKMEGFKSYIVIGRKRLDLFHKKHNKSESEFYFDIVYHLLKDRLNDSSVFYQILLSTRAGNSGEKLKEAIEKAIERDNKKRKKPITIHYDCRTIPSDITPELSIIDYLMWALQRYILLKDSRFYNALVK